MSKYLTISETAKLLNKTTKTLRRWDEEGKLSAVRDPMSNYRVYRKVEVETLFADFLQTDFEETVSNFVVPANEYKVLELFAGAGGLAVGMEKAGLKCVALNEIERILHENGIEILVRDNKLNIYYDGKYINIVDTYNNKEKANRLPRKYFEEKFVVEG